jgi:hypothetical protein
MAFVPRLILLAALSTTALPALAQPAEHKACEAVSDAALPAPLAGWTGRVPLAAAADAGGAAKAELPVGKGVDAQLRHNGEVAFPVLPAKPGGSVSYGGLYGLRIAEAGDYQVSLGSGAWIELVQAKSLVESTAHAPGPACTTLKKTVVFPLKPGRYVLEITGNGEAVLPVMVTRVVR